jgi:hypothetical protein
LPIGRSSSTGTRPIICLGRLRHSERGWRCWSRSDPAAHYAFYEFADVAQAQALIGSTKMEPLVADFDRVWGNRVSRRREILEIAQEMTS